MKTAATVQKCRNIILEIFRKCHPNITKIKQTKEDKNFQIYNFFLFKCPIRLSRTSVALIQDFITKN